MNYRCLCYGFYTFKEQSNGNYDICLYVFLGEGEPCIYDDSDGECSYN